MSSLNQCEKKKITETKFQLTNPPLSIIHVANLSLKYRERLSATGPDRGHRRGQTRKRETKDAM